MSMCYDDGSTLGWSGEEAEREAREYIMENILDIICEEIKICCACEGIELAGENALYVLKSSLAPHYEPVPCSDWYTDEYGNETQDYEDEWVNGHYNTYDDEIAYIGWKCGLNITVTINWTDGSPTFTLTLPRTYEEYVQNQVEGKKFWREEIAG